MNYNKKSIKTAAAAIRAINHPLRQDIIDLLSKREVPVTDLYVKLRVEQSVCSQQLKIMRDANIVKVRRDGKFKYYSLNQEILSALNAKIEEINKLVG